MKNSAGQVARGSLYTLVAALAITSTGCLLAAAAVGGGAATAYAYYKGQICQEYPAPFQDTWLATRDALRDLQMPILEERRDGPTVGYMTSRGSDNTQIRIDLETYPSKIPAEGVVTRVCVRVATFGDQPTSERILHHVGRYLVPKSVTPTTGAPTGLDKGVQPVGWTRPAETAAPPLADATPEAKPASTAPAALAPVTATPVPRP